MPVGTFKRALMQGMAGFSIMLLVAPAIHADQLVTTEFQITNSPNHHESTPRLGEDSISQYVTFISSELTQSGIGAPNVLVQRINENGLMGAPIPIASNAAFPDAHQDFIVYVA